MDKIKIGIVENNKLVADLMSDYLSLQDDFHLVFKAYSGNEFLAQEELVDLADVLILDLKMRDGSGTDVIEAMKKRGAETKILVLSSYYDPNYLGYLFKLGANAFVPKEIEKDKLIQVIRRVNDYGFYFTEEQMTVMRTQVSTKKTEMPLFNEDLLSSREKDVLKLLCRQMTAKEIAEKLFISKKTVETHKSNLLLKTGARNVAGLVIFASNNKLVDLNEIII